MNQKYMLHYTSLPRLIEILETGLLPLTNPIFWKDKNDAFSVAKSSSKAVGVICFSLMEDESNLFWECYANEGIGVCIVFNQDEIRKIAKGKQFKYDKVTYLRFGKNGNLLSKNGNTYSLTNKRDLAFVKNDAYSNENEYRLTLFTDKNPLLCGKVVDFLQLEKPVSNCIQEILLSPFLEENMRRDVKLLLDHYLEKMKLDIKVSPSKITSDVKWRNAVRKLKRSIKNNKE